MLSITSLSLVLASGCAGAPVTIQNSEQLEFTDEAVFRWRDGQLELHGVSSYRPPHRSPRALAILRDVEFEDFDLTVEALSTEQEYGHRDLVIVFAYRDAAHYAYAHLATKADQNAHHVMLVDGAPRRPVSIERTEGVDWGDEWHELRLTRRGEMVRVFFDNQCVIVATVPPGPGRVGLGSFDDTGIFRSLTVTPR